MKWLESYLENRQQTVKITNYTSLPIDVSSGVPQGSHLGPLLFLLFINDLPTKFSNCSFSLYADDLKIYKVINHPNDGITLQENLCLTSRWCEDNGMQLNIDKCSVISFCRRSRSVARDYQINGNTLKRNEVVKDLGILLDTKLTFKQHINKICISGHSILGFIKRRAKEFNDLALTKSLYCSLVRSILEYACIVWAPYRQIDIDRIESVQKQFLLFALKHLNFSGFVLPPYKSRLLLLNMVPLEDRRKLFSAMFAFDLIQGNIKSENLLKLVDVSNNPIILDEQGS